MSNFVPNEEVIVRPRDPEWFTNDIKKLLRNQHKVFKRYKRNGYKAEDRVVVDRLRKELRETIVNAKKSTLSTLAPN